MSNTTTMTTHRISITFNAEWQVKTMPHYKISSDGKVINAKTGNMLSMAVKGYTKGYYLCGKFHSLNQINNMAERIKDDICPF